LENSSAESAALHDSFPAGFPNPGAAAGYDSGGFSLAEVIPPARRLNFLTLTGVIFFTVCGGAFGIEALVGTTGPGWAVVLILLTPLLWSAPIALMVSELSSAMPREGGYYYWVKRALGDFWGFQEGWWTICYTAVDMAIYPVLFVNYLAFFVPYLQPDTDGALSWEVFLARWGVAAAVIFGAMWLNWNGARAVGINSVLNLLVILLPFALLAYFGFATSPGGAAASWRAFTGGFEGEISAGVLAVGLATVMWNYSGWDNVSTYAEEVNDAPRNYPRALFAALGLAVLVYFFPVFALIGHSTDVGVWNEAAGFPALGAQLGGPALGALLGVAALVSAWSLFNSQILYASRLPYAMARDGWLPAFLRKTSGRAGVPTNALLVCCALSAVFAALPFSKLVVIDILFYSAELLLEFVALLVLRVTEPDLPRPFKIRGGWPVLILISVMPMAFAAMVIWATLSDPEAALWQLGVVGAGLAIGVVLFFVRRPSARNLEQVND
jgi:amino acid transporter